MIVSQGRRNNLYGLVVRELAQQFRALAGFQPAREIGDIVAVLLGFLGLELVIFGRFDLAKPPGAALFLFLVVVEGFVLPRFGVA